MGFGAGFGSHDAPWVTGARRGVARALPWIDLPRSRDAWADEGLRGWRIEQADVWHAAAPTYGTSAVDTNTVTTFGRSITWSGSTSGYTLVWLGCGGSPTPLAAQTFGGVSISAYRYQDVSQTGTINGFLYVVPNSYLLGNSLSAGTQTASITCNAAVGGGIIVAEYMGVTGVWGTPSVAATASANNYSDTLTAPPGVVAVQFARWGVGTGTLTYSNSQTSRQHVQGATIAEMAERSFTSATSSQALGFTNSASSPIAHGFVVLMGTPELVALSPADGATGVAVNATLSVQFDKTLTLGSGNWTVNETGGSTHDTVAAGSTSLSTTTYANDTVTIPHTDLGGGLPYNVQAASGVLTGWTGIGNTTTWNFTTAAGGTTLALTGASVTNTLAAGTAAPSSEVPLPGASITSTLAAGTQSPTLTLPLSGSTAAASLAPGDMTPGMGPILSSAALTVTPAAGDVAMGERTVALSSATDDVAQVAGTIAPDTSKTITGEGLGVTIADGSVAVGLAPALSGAALDLAAEAGTVSPTLTIGLLGAAADIALTAGTISYAADGNITLSLSGLALDVALSAGTAGVAHSQAISGAEAGGAVSSGTMTPGTSPALSAAAVGLGLTTSDLTTARTVAASGASLSLAATAGSMTRSLTIGLSSAAATLALVAGTLTYAQDSNVTVALTGAALSLALTAGTVAPSVARALGGVGAAVAQSAGLVSPGLAVGVTGADGTVASADGSLTPSHSRVLSSVGLSLLASSGNVLPSGGTPVEAIARLLGTFSAHKPGVVASWAETRPKVTATFEDD